MWVPQTHLSGISTETMQPQGVKATLSSSQLMAPLAPKFYQGPGHWGPPNTKQRHTRWVFPKIWLPQKGWFIMENPIRIDDLGGKPTIFGNTAGGIPLKNSAGKTCTTRAFTTSMAACKGGRKRVCRGAFSKWIGTLNILRIFQHSPETYPRPQTNGLWRNCFHLGV